MATARVSHIGRTSCFIIVLLEAYACVRLLQQFRLMLTFLPRDAL